MVEPMLKQYMDILFLSTTLPSQSESMYPSNTTPPSEEYLIPYPTMPWRYLSTCFAAIQCMCLGLDINLLKEFIAKHISSLVCTKYINDPLSCRYIVGSIGFYLGFVSCIFSRFDTFGVAMELQSIIPNLCSTSTIYFPCERNISSDHCHTSRLKK